jgi:hypothetical protein
LPVVAHARDRALADRESVSALIDRCCFHRRSGVVDPAALRIAARAGSDSRLQPVKHEPHGSGATLSLAFRTSSRGRSYEVRRDCWVAPEAAVRRRTRAWSLLRRSGSEREEPADCCSSSKAQASVGVVGTIAPRSDCGRGQAGAGRAPRFLGDQTPANVRSGSPLLATSKRACHRDALPEW